MSIHSLQSVRPTHHRIHNRRGVNLFHARQHGNTFTLTLTLITISNISLRTPFIRRNMRLFQPILNTSRSSHRFTQILNRMLNRRHNLITLISRISTLLSPLNQLTKQIRHSTRQILRVTINRFLRRLKRNNQRRRHLTIQQRRLNSTTRHVSRTSIRRLIHLIRRRVTHIIGTSNLTLSRISRTTKHNSRSIRTTQRPIRLRISQNTTRRTGNTRTNTINGKFSITYGLNHRFTYQYRSRHTTNPQLNTLTNRRRPNRRQRYGNHHLTNTNLNRTRRITTLSSHKSHLNLSQHQVNRPRIKRISHRTQISARTNRQHIRVKSNTTSGKLNLNQTALTQTTLNRRAKEIQLTHTVTHKNAIRTQLTQTNINRYRHSFLNTPTPMSNHARNPTQPETIARQAWKYKSSAGPTNSPYIA